MKKYQLLLFVFLLPFVLLAQKNWSPEQVLKIKNVSSAQVSPDGTKVVYTIREATNPFPISNKNEPWKPWRNMHLRQTQWKYHLI